MKKIIIFIALSIFLLTSLGLPKKVLADINCPQGISGQFLDAETGKPIGNVGFVINETYWDTAYKKESNDTTWTTSSDDQGKFNYLYSLEGYNIILTIGGKSGYITKTIKLSKCFDNIINLEPKVSDDKDMCNKPCDGPNDDSCEGATDNCTYCGIYEENMFKTFYRCMLPPVKEKAVEENKVTQTKYEIPDLAPQINKIVNYSMGIGGIIAFLLIVFGGFQIIVSGGNPERVKAGKEIITAAISGLLLIIFSVFILRVIGYDILAIPGFGK